MNRFLWCGFVRWFVDTSSDYQLEPPLQAGGEKGFYDKDSSYGKTLTLGVCTKTTGTLFADTDIAKALDSATENNIISATCVASGIGGKATSYAKSLCHFQAIKLIAGV